MKFYVLLIAALLAGCQTIPKEQQTAIQQIKEKQATTTDASLHLDLAAEYIKTAEKTDNPEYLLQAINELELFSEKAPQHLEAKLMRYQLYYHFVSSGDVRQEMKLRSLFYEFPEQIRTQLEPPSLALAIAQVRSEGFRDKAGLRALLKDSLQEQSESVRANILLADIYAMDERFNLALPLMSRMAEIHSENATVRKYYGELLLYRDETGCLYDKKELHKDALIQLKKALKLQPEDPEIHEYIGQIYDRLGRTVLALNAVKNYDRLQNDAFSQVALAGANLDAGNRGEADAIYNTHLNSDNTHPVFYREKARLLTSERRWKQATDMWEKFFASTDNISFYDYLSFSYANEQTRGKDVALNRFRSDTARMMDSKWERTLRAYRLDTMDETALFDATTNACQLTEARFNRAMQGLMQGDKQSAKKYLSEVLDQKAYAFVEYKSARMMLEQL